MASGKYKILETYCGLNIAKVNHPGGISHYYGIEINGQLSCMALISVLACKNVIKTYLRTTKNYSINDIPDSVGGGYKQL